MLICSEKVIHGRLEVEWRGRPGMAHIVIGDTSAWIGGDGKVVPDAVETQLDSLPGCDVIAGLHVAQLTGWGSVWVVRTDGFFAAFGKQSDWSAVCREVEVLQHQEDWRAQAIRRESGSWARLLKQAEKWSRKDRDIAINVWMATTSAEVRSADIVGWLARRADEEPEPWDEWVRIGREDLGAGDTRQLAKRVIENLWQLPGHLLTEYPWSAREEARRLWMLWETRTRWRERDERRTRVQDHGVGA